MNLRITKPGTQDLMDKYIGKKFRYKSKYGGIIENILCEDICICDTIEIRKGEPYIESYEISIISDKRNVYKLQEVEFYC